MYRLADRVYYLSIFSMSMSMDVDNCHLNGLCSSEASASCRICIMAMGQPWPLFTLCVMCIPPHAAPAPLRLAPGAIHEPKHCICTRIGPEEWEAMWTCCRGQAARGGPGNDLDQTRTRQGEHQ